MSIPARQKQTLNDLLPKLLALGGFHPAAVPSVQLGDFLDAAAAEIPDMTGQSGKFLTNNGTIASWGAVSLGNWSFSANNATTSGSPTTLRTGWAFTDSTLTFPSSGNILPPGAGQCKVGDGGLEFLAGSFNYLTATIAMLAPIVVETVDSPIAAAATIAPATGIVHITGHAAAIATITPHANLAASGKGGTIVLIFDDALTTWTTGGNIAVAGAATTAGSTVHFTYDHGTTKWYPSRIA